MNWQPTMALMVLFGSMLLVPVATATTDARTLYFDVYMDDREIGSHAFELRTEDEQQHIRTEAEFAVKILFITAFRYEHTNHEIWSDGCLRQIESSTNSNGKQFAVVGAREDGEFVIREGGQTRALEGCVSTFAYWDRERLEQQQQLLNPQTGEFVPVTITSSGQSQIRIGDKEISVDVLQIRAADLDIKVMYDVQNNDWLGLESIVKGGRTLRYLRKPENEASQVS